MPDRVLPDMSWAQVSARRLDRHGLSAPLTDAEPADAVAAMCGAHAQLLTAAEWSVGLRLAGVTRGDVQMALWTGHSLVKTFGPRGTVHLLPTRDLPQWTGALSALPSAPNSSATDVRLAPGQTDAVIEAIADALAEADLTTDELSDAVVARAGAWAVDLVVPAFQGMWPRWRQALPLAGRCGARCASAQPGPEGHLHQPAPVAARLRARRRTARPGRAGPLLPALLRAGPPAQFAQWLGAPRRWAAELFSSLAGELAQVQLGGMPAWLAAGDGARSVRAAPRLRLLPYFDAYVVAGQPRASLPRPCRGAGADPERPGRELPGAAHRRNRRRSLAPAAAPAGSSTSPSSRSAS